MGWVISCDQDFLDGCRFSNGTFCQFFDLSWGPSAEQKSAPDSYPLIRDWLYSKEKKFSFTSPNILATQRSQLSVGFYDIAVISVYADLA